MVNLKYNRLDLDKLYNPDTVTAYFIGFIAGDGCVESDRRLSIDIHEKDVYILQEFKKNFCLNNPIEVRKGTCSVRVKVHQAGIAKAFNKWHVTEGKSHSLRLPEHLPNYLMRHYLAGLFDADGHVCLRKKTGRLSNYGFTSGSLQLIEGIINYLQVYEINGNYQTISDDNAKHKDYYQLRLSNKDVEKFYKLLYNTSRKVYLKRKKDIFDKIINNL